VAAALVTRAAEISEGENMRRSALVLAMTLAIAVLAGCSREKIDWKSAEAADTVEGYDHFIERHPESALVTQARTRVAQLNEDRDWRKAAATDTADAYRQFLAQHESGKWSEEARIRIENFALDGTASGPARPLADAGSPTSAASAAPASKEAQAVPAAAIPVSAPDAALAKPAVPAVKPSVAAAGIRPPTASHAAAAGAKPYRSAAAAATPADKHLAAAATPVSTAKPAAVGATPAPASSPGQFGIQLGAFHSQDAALKNWKQLQSRYDSDLHGLFAHAVPVKQGSDQLFRLQAPVGAESRARGICASLAKQSQPCVVVLPQPAAGR
jgi:hypothetical protein